MTASEFVVFGLSALCGLVVVIVSKQCTHIPTGDLRHPIQRTAIFHTASRRGLDCRRVLAVLVNNSKVAHYP